MKQIRFTFVNGKTEVEGEGFHGPACEAAIGKFLEALGGETETREHTLEYWEAEAAPQNWQAQDA